MPTEQIKNPKVKLELDTLQVIVLAHQSLVSHLAKPSWMGAPKEKFLWVSQG